MQFQILGRVFCSFFFYFLIVTGAGCAAGSRQTATDLAKAGQSLTTVAQGNFSALRDDLDLHIEVLFIESGLSNKPPPSDQQIQAIKSIQESLILRERVLIELGRLYGTLGQLAGIDAAADVEGKVNDLTDSVNAFATTVGSDKPPIDHVTGGFIGRGAGLIAAEVQGSMLIRASAAIRERLAKFGEDLRKQQFRFESIRQTLDDAQVRLIAKILEKGVDRRSQALSSALAPLSISLSDAEIQTLLTAGGQPLTDALRRVIVLKRSADFRRQQQVLDSTISGIDQLIEQHAAFESGKAIDLEAVAARIAIIKAIIADYQKWREADRTESGSTTKPATQASHS